MIDSFDYIWILGAYFAKLRLPGIFPPTRMCDKSSKNGSNKIAGAAEICLAEASNTDYS
jgi:hypothetical protein